MKRIILANLPAEEQQALIRDDIEPRLARLMDHGQYILGPEIGEMETLLADDVEVRHCISVASGTDALMLALLAAVELASELTGYAEGGRAHYWLSNNAA